VNRQATLLHFNKSDDFKLSSHEFIRDDGVSICVARRCYRTARLKTCRVRTSAFTLGSNCLTSG
jgi:hypothetical protein